MSINNDRPVNARVCVVVSEGDRCKEIFSESLRMDFADSGDEALEALSARPYNVLVASIHLNETLNSGLFLLTKALALHPDLKGIVIGDTGDSDEVLAAFRAGARGFVLGSICGTPEFLKAILCVREGQVWASSQHLVMVLEEFATNKKAAERVHQLKSVLSPRELEIAQLIVRGKGNKEIASALRVSRHTVKNHVAKIFKKLGVSNRSAAVFRLYQHSIVRSAPHMFRDRVDEQEEAINL